jgi:hypothetical protein
MTFFLDAECIFPIGGREFDGMTDCRLNHVKDVFIPVSSSVECIPGPPAFLGNPLLNWVVME